MCSAGDAFTTGVVMGVGFWATTIAGAFAALLWWKARPE